MRSLVELGMLARRGEVVMIVENETISQPNFKIKKIEYVKLYLQKI